MKYRVTWEEVIGNNIKHRSIIVEEWAQTFLINLLLDRGNVINIKVRGITDDNN